MRKSRRFTRRKRQCFTPNSTSVISRTPVLICRSGIKARKKGQNIALWEKLKDERRAQTHQQSRFGNLAEITFSAWDPNKFLTKAHEKLTWIFTPGFLVFNVFLLGFMLYQWVDHRGEIAHDVIEIYNFTHKGFGDIVELWVIIFVVGFLHEASHGLCCKHTGGEVHRMGFLLIYLSPASFAMSPRRGYLAASGNAL